MILADVPAWLATLRDSAIAIGAVLGALLTAAAAAKAPVVRRPVRWLWRRLVSEPLGGWVHGLFDRALAEDRARALRADERADEMHDRLKVVEHEVLTNDGESLRDVAERVEVMSIELMRRTG